MKFNCDCDYCNYNGYLWLLKNNIVWVEIPKNASYNLKSNRFNFKGDYTIEQTPNAHLMKISNIDLNIHKRGFVILRNPIERFKSMISHFFIQGDRAQIGKHWLDKLGFNYYNNNNIVDIVFNVWDKIKSIYESHHFNSQSSFIPNEFFEIKNHMVYNTNEVSFMFGLPKGINSSNSSNIFISDKNLKNILDIYKDDVDLYRKYFSKI